MPRQQNLMRRTPRSTSKKDTYEKKHSSLQHIENDKLLDMSCDMIGIKMVLSIVGWREQILIFAKNEYLLRSWTTKIYEQKTNDTTRSRSKQETQGDKCSHFSSKKATFLLVSHKRKISLTMGSTQKKVSKIISNIYKNPFNPKQIGCNFATPTSISSLEKNSIATASYQPASFTSNVSTTTSKTNKRRQIPLELIHDRIITGKSDELTSLTPISSSSSLSKAL